MKKKLIILANSETLCAYRMLTDDLTSPQIKTEQLPIRLPPLQPDPTETSDIEGRFPGGTTVKNRTSMKHGEPSGRQAEKRKRLLQNIAHAICEIINREEFDIWNLAIPKNLSKQLLEQLPMHVQHRLTHIETGDYTRQPIKKIEHLFSS